MTAVKPVSDDGFAFARELNRLAYARPPIEGWLDSFLGLMCERLGSVSVKGIQVVQVVGNEALQVGAGGSLPEQAPTRYLLDKTSAASAAIRTRQIAIAPGIRAYPITIGEDMLGALIVYAGLAAEAVDDMLGALALQLGPALVNEHRVPGPTTGRLTHQIDVMRSLYEITKAVSSALDSEEVLSRAAQSLVEMLPIDHVGVVLFDDSKVNGRVVAEFPDNGMVDTQIPTVDALYNALDSTQKPVAISRVEDADQFGLDPATLESLGLRSVAYIPMFVLNDLAGTVSLDVYFEKHEFTAEELDGAMAVTTQLGISIRNAELYSEIRRQSDERERIADLSRRITSTFDRQEIYQIIKEETQKLLPARVLGIGLRQPGEDGLHLVILSDDKPRTYEFRAQDTALGFACDTALPEFVEDISVSPYQDYRLLAELGGHAAMVVPLLVGGRTVGAFCIAHAEVGVYTSIDLSMFDQIGTQLGIALENSRLYQDASQRAESEELMNRLSSTMQGRGNLQFTLQATLQQMAQALGAKRARIRMQIPPAPTIDTGTIASLSRLAGKLSEKREG
jgi:GAF domain-containing protein